MSRHVGYAPGEAAQFGGLRGNAIVATMAGLRGGVDDAFVRQFCERFDLDLGRRFREYSSGNKRKLAILLAFMHRPKVLILDEPTAGLDPLNQQEFYALVREARDGGATVFLSSHVLSEVEHISDRVAIIRRGRLVRVARLEELHELRLHEVEIDFNGTVPEAAIRAATGVDHVVVEGNRVRCSVQGGFQPLLRALASADVVRMMSREPSLEEVFLAYYRDQ
jgi:ABC-2 type transport system ATP-binding protein